MRTGNKGYTLFELMVSVAIFALIMVGIISLMRTSSIFYMGGQSEVRLQEEAQIALNQIEDLLIDTNDKVATVDGTDGARVYSVHKADGVYGLKQSGDQLFYKKLSSGSISDDAGWVLMADGVENFKIDGIDYTGGNRDHGDNCVAVSIAFSNGKYEYEAKRDVYFRNAIENNTAFTIPVATVTPGTGNAVTFNYTYHLRRGENLNLFAEFDIVSDAVLMATSSVDPTTYYTMTSSMNATSGITEYIVKTGSNLQTTSNNTTEAQGIYVSGKDKGGIVINVLLLTDPVAYIQPIPVFFLEHVQSQNEGSPVWVEFKGVDLRGVTDAQYQFILYDDINQNSSYDSGEKGPMVDKSDEWKNFGTLNNFISSPVKINMSVKACDKTGFMMVYQGNDAATGALGYVTSGRRFLRVNFKFKIDGKDVEGTLDYRLSTLGAGFVQ